MQNQRVILWLIATAAALAAWFAFPAGHAIAGCNDPHAIAAGVRHTTHADRPHTHHHHHHAHTPVSDSDRAVHGCEMHASHDCCVVCESRCGLQITPLTSASRVSDTPPAAHASHEPFPGWNAYGYLVASTIGVHPKPPPPHLPSLRTVVILT